MNGGLARLPAPDQVGSAPHQETSSICVGSYVGDHVLDHLERRERPPELLPLLRVVNDRIETALDDPEPVATDTRPLSREYIAIVKPSPSAPSIVLAGTRGGLQNDQAGTTGRPTSSPRRSRCAPAVPKAIWSALARLRYRCAGCSQVIPIPPCSWTHSSAAFTATSEQ